MTALEIVAIKHHRFVVHCLHMLVFIMRGFVFFAKEFVAMGVLSQC